MRNEELEYEEFSALEKMASMFTYRNGKIHDDGSRGEVKISPAALKDLLIEAYLKGKHNEI